MHARKGTLIRRLVLASLTILTVLSVAGWIAPGGRRIRLWALATDWGITACDLEHRQVNLLVGYSRDPANIRNWRAKFRAYARGDLDAFVVWHKPRGLLPATEALSSSGLAWQSISVPLWLVTMIFAGYPLVALFRGPVRRRRRRNRNQCIHCGYNLKGLTKPRCPECGEGFEMAPR